ncbi:MAG: NAD(P)H-binding protein [Cyclobacteriaceae bacterium]
MGKKAIVAGATGLVGSELIKILFESDAYEEVVLIVRSKQNFTSKKVTQIVESDFEKIHDYQSELNGEDYYCALGTTIGKAGSKEAFEKVDYEYPLLLAKLAKSSTRFKQYAVVSAMGADPKSFFFYNKVKGNLEVALKKLELKSLHIFQPNLLIGDRNEFRFGEMVFVRLLKILSFILLRPNNPIFAIKAITVAKAMYNTSLTDNAKQEAQTYSPSQIKKLAS